MYRLRVDVVDLLPFIPLFPFVRVLLQFEVGAFDLLCNLFYSPSGGV